LKNGFRGDLGQFDFDRKMSSFKIGRKVRVKFCHHSNCGSPSGHTVVEVVGPFSQDDMVHSKNDWARYVEVHHYD